MTDADVASAPFLRSRIAILLNDPRVAERVRRRLPRQAADAVAGTPTCFRAAADVAVVPLRVKAGECRAICGSVDCLCGAYPRSLAPEEVVNGPRLAALAF